jgi:hypothetical protein
MDVNWSSLFPKSGGSGKGGSFTGKVLAPNQSPYKVAAWDRLIIDATSADYVIDPSGLKSDESFQIIDTTRQFDKHPVAIDGSVMTIPVVGAGNTLRLNTVGAGELWEFICDGTRLYVSDSPGYIGEGNGTGGGGDITIDTTLADSPDAIANSAVFKAMQTKADLVNGQVPANQLPPQTGGGGTPITVDPSLNPSSNNPLANSGVATALTTKADLVNGQVPANQLPPQTGGGGTPITIDSAPTAGSPNAVSSDGVFTALAKKADAGSGGGGGGGVGIFSQTYDNLVDGTTVTVTHGFKADVVYNLVDMTIHRGVATNQYAQDIFPSNFVDGSFDFLPADAMKTIRVIVVGSK